MVRGGHGGPGETCSPGPLLHAGGALADAQQSPALHGLLLQPPGISAPWRSHSLVTHWLRLGKKGKAPLSEAVMQECVWSF